MKYTNAPILWSSRYIEKNDAHGFAETLAWAIDNFILKVLIVEDGGYNALTNFWTNAIMELENKLTRQQFMDRVSIACPENDKHAEYLMGYIAARLN